MSQDTARKHLKRAEEKYTKARTAQQLLSPEHGLTEQQAAWESFLYGFAGCYGHLTNAARDAHLRSIKIAIDHDFKNDAKLAYLHQARNEDEHGCEVGRDSVPSSVNIGGMFHLIGTNQTATFEGVVVDGRTPSGHSYASTLSGSITKVDGVVRQLDLQTGLPVAVGRAFLKLRTVKNRGSSFDVPSGLGSPAEHAVVLSRYGLEWLDGKRQLLRAALEG